jgi:hypothetical protein
MARADFDPDLAGAGLLGREAAERCLPETASLITQLFSDNRLFERFTGHILSEVQMDNDSAGQIRCGAIWICSSPHSMSTESTLNDPMSLYPP